jgi:regulator of replication initiation timing
VAGKNMIIVNKFFEVEARINTLMEILEDQKMQTESLSEENREWLLKMKKLLLHTV